MFQQLLNWLQRYRQRKTIRKLLLTLSERYERQQKTSPIRDETIEQVLCSLQHNLKHKTYNPLTCNAASNLLHTKLKSQLQDTMKELITTILLAVFILVFVRQMVFEHQLIPSGSMRPTFREMDRVIVSKTSYGINNPLGFIPLAFNPDLLQRGQIVTLTSEHLPMLGKDTLYFGFFPGKKRFVKRLMAKMNDRVWFYGGHLWVVDGKNHTLNCSDGYAPGREYIPFHYFFGAIQAHDNELNSYHFCKKTTSFKKGSWGRYTSEIPPGQDTLPWGMQQYGMARLLTKKELHYSCVSTRDLPAAEYYLEIAHHPTIYPTALASRDSSSPFYVYRTLLALPNHAVDNLLSNMYTGRFVVKDHKAFRYDYESGLHGASVTLPHVEDGTFEFDAGVAYRVGSDGERYSLHRNHALYNRDLISVLYNCGVNWDPRMLAQPTNAPALPFRYVYFDRGDLKSMGGLLLSQGDQTLQDFLKKEQQTREILDLYPPFCDVGPPSQELITSNGLTLNEYELLLLGDNHAGSSDSRDFGLVHYDSIRGSTLWRIWPPSSLMEGIAAPAPAWNRYDIFVLAFFIVSFVGWKIHRKRQLKKIRRY